MRRLRVLFPLCALALVLSLPAHAQDRDDLLANLEQALSTPDGEALIEWLGGLEPVDRPDEADDTQSFDTNDVPDNAVRNDIVATTDARVRFGTGGPPLECGGTNGEYRVVCPDHPLQWAALDDSRVFGVEFATPLVTDSVIHIVVAGNAPARPDVPARSDQPRNLLTGSDQFLRLQINPDGTLTYGYFLWDGTQFGTFRVDTMALTSPQRTYFIVSAPQVDWDTYTVFTDAEHPSGIPVGDGTDSVGFSNFQGNLNVTAPPPGGVAAVPAAGAGDDNLAGWLLAGAGVFVVGAGGTLVWRARRRGEEEPPVVVSTDDTWARTAFETATFREAEIQARLEGSYELMASRIATGLADFRDATGRYASEFDVVRRDAQWLQGVADEWATARRVTGAFDLVLGLLQLGPGALKLGRAGWARLRMLLFGADEAAETALSAANALINSSDELKDIASEAAGINMAGHLDGVQYLRGADNVFIEAAAHAIEGGVDFATVAPARIAELRNVMPLFEAMGVLWMEMAEAAAAARGWVKATDETRALMTEVVVNVRSFCAGRVTNIQDAKEAMLAFNQLVRSQPRFFETVGDLYGVIGDPRQADCVVQLLYHADDLDFLWWLHRQIDAGVDAADLPAAYQAYAGPIASTGQRIATGIAPVQAVSNASSIAGALKTGYEFHGLFSDTPMITSVFPSYGDYISQHGIFAPTFFGYEAGDSLPLNLTLNVVNAYGGMSTWLTGLQGTVEADVLWTDSRAEMQPHFRAMGDAAYDVLAAVDRLQDAVRIGEIAIDDRRALRDMLATFDGALAGASPELRDELAPQLAEQRAHIEQKLAQLDAVVAVLADARNWIGIVRDSLATQVRAGRGPIEWADPNLALTFVSVGLVLDGLAHGVLHPPVHNPLDDVPRGKEQLPDWGGRVTLDVEPRDPSEEPDFSEFEDR